MNSARHEPPRLASVAANESGLRLAELTDLKSELPPRSIIGRMLQNRYVPESLSSDASFSVRYLARDTATQEMVCLELLPRRAITCFTEIRQAVAKLAALGDPNIVEVSGRGMVGGAWPFLVTEHCPRTLVDVLDAGPLELRRLVRIGAQAAGALAAAHGAGVLHGVLALDRIACSGSGPLEVARISGFGIAPLALSWPEAQLSGAPEAAYASPEQLEGGRLDARSDIYALGAILYELATGTLPFGADGAGVARLRHELPPASRQRGSNELAFRAFDKIVERCLMRAPERRYANAVELGVDLGRLDAALGRAQAAARAHEAEGSSRHTPRASSERPSGVELSPARRPPQKSIVGMRKLPKVIVQGS
jgi:serine/threonine-protein kinase